MYSNDPLWVHAGYWISFAIAVLWAVLNYISHIRMNNMYKKQDDLQVYVNQLVMSEEDKLELRTYLEDYVQDLMKQGNTEADAMREAINQFKVKEFLSLSKNTMFFNLHAHYYLIGWTFLSVIASILVWIFELTLFPYPLITLTIESIFIAYAIGLFGMFFLYKIIDAVIYRKFKELF
ncbi:permease prefix domain 1-containing protein [Bacillus sp. CMF21]|nr:permease prefix domain 1-containing protein [Bacillus sp. CMF21]